RVPCRRNRFDQPASRALAALGRRQQREARSDHRAEEYARDECDCPRILVVVHGHPPRECERSLRERPPPLAGVIRPRIHFFQWLRQSAHIAAERAGWTPGCRDSAASRRLAPLLHKTRPEGPQLVAA